MKKLIFSFILLIFLLTPTVYCERRGENIQQLDKNIFAEYLKNVLKNIGNPFFTQENIKLNSWHVTSRWWRSQFLGKLSDEFNQTGVDELCSKRKESCTFFDRKEYLQLPKVEPGSWKSCAVVAYGSNLLRNPRGSQIDSYETVFRLGMVPLSKFSVEAGVKNTFVYIRDRKLRLSRGNFVNQDKNGFLASRLDESQRPKAIIYSSYRKNPTEGWKTITFGGDLTLRLDRKLSKIISKMTRFGLPPDPSSGLVLPMILLFSGHCTKIGIFGISTTMGPRYWEASFEADKLGKNKRRMVRNLSSNHNTKFEAILWKVIEKISPPLQNTQVKFYD